MSFLTGKQKEMTPSDIQDYRKQLLGFIGREGFGKAMTGYKPDISLSPIDTGAYERMFAQRRGEALAQAKEQAGNLTGSGFASILGTTAGRSVTEENAFLSQLSERRNEFLAQLMEQSRQASASRFAGLLGLPASYTGQMGYQPGFLDYLFQGAKAAAPLIAAV